MPVVSSASRIRPIAAALVLAALLPACAEEATAPAGDPVVMADLQVLDLHASDPDPSSDATCQTGAGVLLKADGSHDPAGQPLTYEWRDEVDYGDGSGRHASSDWGPEGNVLRTQDVELGASLYTIAVHYVTLTVRTRDGRSASETLRVTVTACEDCGTP
jgi:hypothetical protein